MEEDSYYFVQFSNSSQGPTGQEDIEVNLVIQFNETEYTVNSTGNPNCTIDGHMTGLSCTAKAKGTYGTKALLLISYDSQSDFSVANKINWVCIPNAGVCIGICFALFVFYVLVFAPLGFLYYHKKKKHRDYLELN